MDQVKVPKIHRVLTGCVSAETARKIYDFFHDRPG